MTTVGRSKVVRIVARRCSLGVDQADRRGGRVVREDPLLRIFGRTWLAAGGGRARSRCEHSGLRHVRAPGARGSYQANVRLKGSEGEKVEAEAARSLLYGPGVGVS